MTDTGVPEVKPTPIPDGLEALKKTSGPVSSATKSSPSWDEDWGAMSKGPAPSLHSSTTNILPSNPLSSSHQQSVQVMSVQNPSSMISTTSSSQQTAISCPAVDIEWPPRSSSTITTQSSENKIEDPNLGASSTSGFDDIDPFADWPPQPSASGSLNNGSFLSKTNNNWAFNSTQSSIEPVRQPQGMSNLNTGVYWSTQNSIGSMKQSKAVSVSGTSHSTDKKMTDLGSIFISGNKDVAAPRLAPPPPTAVGRGRGGGGRGNQTQRGSRSTNAKPQSEQPPLLDLL